MVSTTGSSLAPLFASETADMSESRTDTAAVGLNERCTAKASPWKEVSSRLSICDVNGCAQGEGGANGVCSWLADVARRCVFGGGLIVLLPLSGIGLSVFIRGSTSVAGALSNSFANDSGAGLSTSRAGRSRVADRCNDGDPVAGPEERTGVGAVSSTMGSSEASVRARSTVITGVISKVLRDGEGDTSLRLLFCVVVRVNGGWEVVLISFVTKEPALVDIVTG